MSGRLICFVGPSGVGKDTVMEAFAARSGASLARRVITRPSESAGEVFDGVSDADFAAREAAGEFALTWQAHGLSYGVPNAIRDDLDAGRDVLANLSRTMLTKAAHLFPGTLIVCLTADPEILAARLAARGRENESDIAKRLARGTLALPEGLEVIEIDNGGALETTLARLDTEIAKRKDAPNER